MRLRISSHFPHPPNIFHRGFGEAHHDSRLKPPDTLASTKHDNESLIMVELPENSDDGFPPYLISG